jgi:peptidoglycan hydrolase CwlO-like protein
MRQTIKKILWMMAAVLGLVISVPSISYASGSTQDKIDQAQEDKDELEAIISAHEKELESLKGEQSELQKKLSTLNAELTTISQELYSLEEQIKQKEADIALTQENLAKAKETESWQQLCMDKRIQYTYERGTDNYFKTLLMTGGFGKLLNLSTYVESVLGYDDKNDFEKSDCKKLLYDCPFF